MSSTVPRQTEKWKFLFKIEPCFNPSTFSKVFQKFTKIKGWDNRLKNNVFNSHLRNHPKNAKYPSPVALKCDESRNVLTCVYDDHSLYVWNISNIKYVGKIYSLLYHSSCIWGIEMRPVSLMDDVDYLPSDTFITYASDDTLRFWNFDEEKAHNFQKNVYSNVCALSHFS